MTRQNVLIQACNQCMKELYKYTVPHVTWEQFKKECAEYSEKYMGWDDWIGKYPEWEGKSVEECIPPKPFEFYYLPQEIMKDICDSYIYAYKIDDQQKLLDTIEILKMYCDKPIVDKYIEGKLKEDGTRWPGHKGFGYPDNLLEEVNKLLIGTGKTNNCVKNLAEEIKNKFFEFLDMAGNFFRWDTDLNTFNTTIYLGVSPCSNKETVIKNWKKYRNMDIEINDKEIKENYYGEEADF